MPNMPARDVESQLFGYKCVNLMKEKKSQKGEVNINYSSFTLGTHTQAYGLFSKDLQIYSLCCRYVD